MKNRTTYKIIMLVSCLTTLFSKASNPPIELFSEIISAPDYLFGSAKYATPLEIKTSGCGNIYIDKIEVEFTAAAAASNNLNVGNRFVANDGPQQLNGTSDTYTCFLPSSFYDGLEVPDYRLKGGGPKFRATVTFRDADENTNLPTGESHTITTPWKLLKWFFDERVDCCDIGEDITLPIASVTQKTSKAGEAKFEYIYTTNNQHPLIKDPVDLGLWGFDRDGDETTAKATQTATDINLKVSLIDDGDFLSYGAGNKYKSRIYGVRTGGYIFFSYGGKSHDVLDPNEKAMDLDKETSSFDWDLVAVASSKVECVSETALPLQTEIGLVGGASGLGWALAPSPWGAIFGTISSIGAIYAGADSDNVNSAEGTINAIFERRPRSGGVVSLSKTSLAKQVGTGVDASNSNLVLVGKACRVGDQYNYYYDINAAVTAESKVAGRSESTCLTEFKAGSATDKSKMTIKSY